MPSQPFKRVSPARRGRSDMRVAWFAPDVVPGDFNRTGSAQWIRCLQLLPYLEERGVTCSLNDPDATADISIFVRGQDARTQALAQSRKARGNRIVFDLCVNYFDESFVAGVGAQVGPTHVANCRAMTRIADAIFCASSNIGARAAREHPRVEILPDSVDPRHFSRRKDESDFDRPKLRAIWGGVAIKANELSPVLPILKRAGWEIVLISEKRPTAARCWPFGEGAKFRRWRYETFPDEIVGGELCFSFRPLDTPYNLGHSSFKISAFVAQGVPALTCPMPSYVELLSRGGGCVAEDFGAWQRVAERLRSDRSELKRMSRSCPAAIAPLLTPAVADRYVEALGRLLANPRAHP
jgi:hypothetical protein